MVKGVKPMQKPTFWSKEWYIKQKNDGMPDMDIAEYMDVSIMTLNRWKKQLDIPKFAYTLSNAKGRDYDGPRSVSIDD